MEGKVVILLACLAVAQCMVRRDASTSAPLLPFQDFQKHAIAFHNTFTEQLRSLANSTSNSHLDKVLKESSDTVLKELGVLTTNLNKVLADANGKVREVVKSSYNNIEKAVEELRAQHHDVPKRTEKLRDSLQIAVKSAVVETQKIAKEIAANVEETNKKLLPKIKAAYEDFVKNALEVQKKITEAAKENKV